MMSALCSARLRRSCCIAEGDVDVVLRPEVIGHFHLATDITSRVVSGVGGPAEAHGAGKLPSASFDVQQPPTAG